MQARDTIQQAINDYHSDLPPPPTDTTGPTLTGITWTDADNSGGPTEGDTLRFDFSTAMDTSTIDSIDEISSSLDSSASGTTDYGTAFTFNWNTDLTQLTITLGPGVTIESGDRVNPTSAVTDTAGNPDNTNPPGPAVPSPNSFTGSVPLPGEVSTDPKVIGTNAGLALAFVIVFYFAATLFNSTMRDNYETIRSWLGFIGRPINRVTSRFSSSNSKRFRYLIILGSVAIFALIYSFLDPYFTNGYMGLALFISLAIAIFIVTYTYEGIQAMVSRNTFRIPAMVRILPIGIAVAVIFVLFSRAIDFHPGLIYGIIGAYASVSATRKLVKNQQAITILIGALFLIAIVVFAFFLRMLIPESSIEGGSFWISVADGILVGIFVIGLEGLLFALLPITFMDGAKVAAWKWWVWLPLFALIVFLFVHIIINEHGGLAEAAGDMEVVMISGMLGLFLTLSALTWLYFQRRRKPAPVKIRTSSAIVDPAQSPQQIFCTSCGAPNTKDSNFCTECGSKLTH